MAAEIANSSTVHYELLNTRPLDPLQPQGSLLGSLSGWLTWQYIVTALLAVVLYDQGNQQPTPGVHGILSHLADMANSNVHQKKGLYCGTCSQDPAHGTIPTSIGP